MLATLKGRRRHLKLMRAAHHLLREAWLSPDRQQADITAADLAAYTFGRHRIDLDLDEAERFLEAAGVTRGEAATPSA